jgi:hypothetical protein
LAKRPVIFEPICICAAANHPLTIPPQFLCQRPHAQHIIEHDDIGPIDLAPPVVSFRDEAVGDFALIEILNVVLDLVAFLDGLPGNIADQTVPRDEQKALVRHGSSVAR